MSLESFFSTEQINRLLGSACLPDHECQEFLQSLTLRHPKALRFKREIIAAETPFTLEPVPWYPLAHQAVADGERPTRDARYAAGNYYVQDAGSLLALAAAAAETDELSGQLVCDLCAAPGGKATGVLETIGDGFLLANEPVRSRVAPLAFNLARVGSDRYAVCSVDPEKLAQRLGGIFDAVLVDAPCSGQALLGQSKQSVAALSDKQIEHSAARQQRILRSARNLLRPGGRIIYSTCTFAEAENEAQVRWMIDDLGGASESIPSISQYESKTTPGAYRLWPHRHRCAGSFAACVSFDDEVADGSWHPRRRKHIEKPPKDAGQWYELPDSTMYVTKGPVTYAWTAPPPGWVEELAVAGPEIAYRAGQTWKPSHAGALRCSRIGNHEPIQIDGPEIANFLDGHPVNLQQADVSSEKGWRIVDSHFGPIGWAKSDGRIGKNHLPTAARMKCERA